MSNDTWHEPSVWRDYQKPVKASQKAPAPFVNEMPVNVLVCPCSRLWASCEAMAAHVARGCAAPEEEK